MQEMQSAIGRTTHERDRVLADMERIEQVLPLHISFYTRLHLSFYTRLHLSLYTRLHLSFHTRHN